jgi:uncharacterized protein (TIRG00374 family)
VLAPASTRALWLRGALGVALGCAFLALAARNVDVRQVWSGLRDYEYGWLAAMIAIWLVTLGVKVYRWRALFPATARPSRTAVFDAFAIGGLANNALPGRLGDLVRAAVIKQNTERMGLSGALATIVLEKVLDGLIVLVLLASAVMISPVPAWLVSGGIVAAAAFVGGLSALLVLRQTAAKWTARAARQRPTSAIGRGLQRLASTLEMFAFGLEAVATSRTLIRALLLTLVIWLLEATMVLTAIKAAGLALPFSAALVTIALLCVGTMLPAAPGYLGTYQYFVVLGLGLYGVSASSALGLGLFLNAFFMLASTAVGVAGLISERRYQRRRVCYP